jgi:hypothetical protein
LEHFGTRNQPTMCQRRLNAPLSRGQRTIVAVLAIFLVLSLLLTYPLVGNLGRAVEDRQDALLNVWITAWDGHQLLADPLHLFDANIFHPYPRTLAYSELVLGNALLALPITAVSGNPILGYNVALLLSFVLSGLGMVLLVRRLTGQHAAGLVAGLIYTFCAYRLTNLAQAQLLITQWMPFALLALDRLLRGPSRQQGRAGLLFVLFFSLQALSSFYYAMLLALAVGAFSLWSLITEARSRWRAGLTRLVLALCVCALLMAPFALPYFQVQRELGFERSLADNEPFSASLTQYALVPPGAVLHGTWLPSDATPRAGGYPVDALFPGLTALALAAWGLLRGHGHWRWFFLLLLLGSVVLSLGPRLYVAPDQPAGVDIRLPYAWLYAVVPGFQAFRAPVRFDVLATLALAVLAGCGVSALRPRAGLAALLAGLVVLESLVWPAAQTAPVPVGQAVPPVYDWLAEQPPAPILELPMAFTPGGPQLEYQYSSTYHWHTTPDGYSGFIPPRHGQIVYEMERFPSERSTSLLQRLGVRYVLIHVARLGPIRWTGMQTALADVDALEPVELFDDTHVYQVRPRSSAPDALRTSLYAAPRVAAGAEAPVHLIAVNDGRRSVAILPTDELELTACWDDACTELCADVPLVTSPHGGASVIRLALEAPAQPGSYQLTLRERSRLLGGWTGAAQVQVGDQTDLAFPVPARLSEWRIPPTGQPGRPLPVRLTWRPLGKIDAYYSVYVKLLDAAGNPVASWDGQPQNGAAPTLLWVPDEPVVDTVTLELPADFEPGVYQVEVGMYRAEDLARCLTLNADGVPVDHIELGRVVIEP